MATPYCAGACATIRRRESPHRAGARLPAALPRSVAARGRQRAWRARRAQKVTHQGSPASHTAVIVASLSTESVTEVTDAEAIHQKQRSSAPCEVITVFDTNGSMTPKQFADVHLGALAKGEGPQRSRLSLSRARCRLRPRSQFACSGRSFFLGRFGCRLPRARVRGIEVAEPRADPLHGSAAASAARGGPGRQGQCAHRSRARPPRRHEIRLGHRVAPADDGCARHSGRTRGLRRNWRAEPGQ